MPSHDKWNPWHGCKKCSAGCQNCYMYALDRRHGVMQPSDVVHKTNKFKYPIMKYRDGSYKIKSGERLMVNMTSDTFIEEADEWRDDMWDMVRQRPDVIFWFLTKRPERIMEHLPYDWGDGYDNVMFNITCEDQFNFINRIQYLLNVPAKHKGLCLAPLIGPVDITYALQSGQIEEVSVGGENYDDPRPCHYEWVKNIALKCKEYKTNFTFYETGTKFVYKNEMYIITSKAEQARMAFICRLNQKYYNIEYDLMDMDGVHFRPEERYVKQYNKHHCILCSNQQMCNGCSDCGDCCGGVELISYDEICKYQDEYMKYVLTK